MNGRWINFTCSSLFGWKMGFCQWNITLAAFLSSSSCCRSLPSPESPPRKAFIITLILRGPFTTCWHIQSWASMALVRGLLCFAYPKFMPNPAWTTRESGSCSVKRETVKTSEVCSTRTRCCSPSASTQPYHPHVSVVHNHNTGFTASHLTWTLPFVVPPHSVLLLFV